MIGAGGAIPAPDGYWQAVERICRDRGVLLVADEVISGFGRLGTWFGCERYGFTPDLMTCAKGISSGYVPLGAVGRRARPRALLARRRCAVRPRRHLRRAPGRVCRGSGNLDILERERLVERVGTLEPFLSRLLEPLARPPAASPACAASASRCAVELDAALLAEHPAAGAAVVLAARSTASSRGSFAGWRCRSRRRSSSPRTSWRRSSTAIAASLREVVPAR